MIGRQQQLDTILAAVGAAEAGANGQNVLLVTGEAGIGKTTLLREVQQSLAESGAQQKILSRFASAVLSTPLVAFVQCSTPLAGRDIGEVESLQPWAGLMAQLLELSAKDVVEKKKTKFDFAKFFVDTAPAWVTMVPLLGPSVGAALEIVGATYDQYYFNKKLSKENASQNASNQQQVFQQYINFLAQAAAQQPLVLVIDDFHWADTSSTNLLFTAARELQGKPVVFLIAYRADDAMSSRGGEGHPLLHIRNELQRYNLSLDIDVPVLTSTDLDQLLRKRYPNYRNNDAFEEWLARAGSGNALFITQFLATLEEDGYIDTATGAIHEGFESARIPASAQAVVQERIRRLSEDTREMLRYASVEGDVFTAAVLALLTEIPQLKLLQKLRLAEETYNFVRSLGKQRLYTRETSAYKFTHALLHKVLYDSLGEEERELLHEAVFDILKSEWDTARSNNVNIEGISARLAIHAEMLRKYDFAAEVLLGGARASWSEYAEEEALRQIEKIRALMKEATEQRSTQLRRIHGEACNLQARIHIFHARSAEALQSVREAISDFEAIGDRRLFCHAHSIEIEAIRIGGNPDEAEQRAHALLQMGRESGLQDVQAMALGELGAQMYLRAHYSDALQFMGESLELTSETDRRTKSRLLNNIGLAEVALGQFDSAMEHFRSSLDVLAPYKDRISEANYFNNIAIIQYQLGNIKGSLENMQASMELRKTVGDVPGVAISLHNIGLMYMQLGAVDEALDYFTQSLPQARSLNLPILLARLETNLGNLERMRGNGDSALHYYNSSLETARSVDNRDGIAVALLNLGALLRTEGHFHESKKHLEDALVLAREIGVQEYEGLACGELAMLKKDTAGDVANRAELLREVVEELRASVSLLENFNTSLAAEWKETLMNNEQELATVEAAQQ